MNDNWGAETWRQPKEQDGDVLLSSEHGRIIGRIDYRSHWFKLVKQRFGGIALLVSHGGGEERITLGHCTGDAIAAACSVLDPDTRYKLLHAILDVSHDASRAARDKTAAEYRTAFAAGTLKKRKMRGQAKCKVWIETTSQAVSA